METKFVKPISLIVICLTAGYFLSCERESAVTSKSGQPLLEAHAIISEFNASRPPDLWVKLQYGTVRIIPTNNNKLLITCDIIGEPKIISYFLQTDESSAMKSIDLGNSEIIFLDSELLINSIDQNLLYTFSLKGIEDSFLKRINPDKQLFGYGIGTQVQSRGLNPRVGPECRCEPTTVGDSDCESGGHGSSSCSVDIVTGACSVACGIGYFACCDHEGGSSN